MKDSVLRLVHAIVLASSGFAAASPPATVVTIQEGKFHINGKPTLEGRSWRGHPVEGLLPNSRMVQGIFDDLNPETAGRWAYPDNGKWDAGRNTREFIASMKEWREHGLLAFTINLQGGSPQGYSKEQPWHNSAFDENGELIPAYLARLDAILDEADRLGMAVILGYFYFGQDERIKDEAAVIRAVDRATGWLVERGSRNVLVEVNNECNVRYDHDILQPSRVHELIRRIKRLSAEAGAPLLVSTSYGGGTIPGEEVVAASDFVLLHGNGVSKPEGITSMVERTRALDTYRGQPIIFNEDDHFDFDKDTNNFAAATAAGASWGYFDFRKPDEPFENGYQSVPVDWAISSDRKKGFFNRVAEMSGIETKD